MNQNYKNKTFGKNSANIRNNKYSLDNTRQRQSKATFKDSDSDENHENELISQVTLPTRTNQFQSVKLNTEKPAQNYLSPTGAYNTAEDKYKLLEELDNCIVTNTDTLSLDRPSLAGTCQDMCPEKERYWKEIGDNVSIFEKDEKDQFDHRKAVKDYGRCSADKKEPEPHDLRPTDVLERTMNYLLQFVVDYDIMKTSWRQWYNFIWTRTRSIRKDITQQNLCNATVIRIVEIITRFHIYCAERLCEESSDEFDGFSNDSNLLNCLQSLKDMYGDMPKDSCPNEAEFRGYMLIMNLDKGAALGEAQKLPISVLSSNEMTFAKRVCSAVTTYNYVRFFRLLQNANLITSCLLHRFIVPMRLRAMRVVNKAYTTHNQVPVSYFYKILCFESMDEAVSFFRGMGFILENDNSAIVLNANTPISDYKMIRRSFKLIEMKQGIQKLSQIFCNDPTIEFNEQLTSCKMISFTDRNNYKGLLKLQSKKVTAIPDNSVKLSHVASKEHFDLSDSEYNVTQDQPEHKNQLGTTIPTRSARESITTRLGGTPQQRFAINMSASTPSATNHMSNLFSSANQGISSLFQRNLSSAKTDNNNDSTKNQAQSNLFGTAPEFFSQRRDVDASIGKGITSSLFNMSNNNNNNNTTFNNNNSFSSSHIPASNRPEFYQSQNKSSTSSESGQLEPEDDDSFLPEEDFNMIADNINDYLSQELCKEMCRNFAVTEMVKAVESDKVKDNVVKEIITETVKEAFICVREEYKTYLSEQCVNDLISVAIKQCCQTTLASCQKSQRSFDKRNISLKRTFFKHWLNFKTMNIKERRSMINLPAAPRIVDDFTICEGFRGKVRKMSTNELVWSPHPIIKRLEQCTSHELEYVPKKIAKKDTLTQTNVSYAYITTVSVNEFVRTSVQERFINVLDRHISALEFAKQVDPSPEKIISDYNNLVDDINSITTSQANISVASVMKLPLISVNTEPLSGWTHFMNRVFNKLEIPNRDRLPLLEEMSTILKYVDNSQELPELSYYHLRLFPWIRIIKLAALNRLSLTDRKFCHMKMEKKTNVVICPVRLQLENTLHGLSIEKCVLECDKHAFKYVRRVVKSPSIRKSRQLSVFENLVTKVAELEKKLDECK